MPRCYVSISCAITLLVAVVAGSRADIAIAEASRAGLEDQPKFGIDRNGGAFAVGLKVVEQYDYSRTFRSTIDPLGKPSVGELARPLQTLVWYPAQRNRDVPMTVGNYVELETTETNFAHPQRSIDFDDWRSALGETQMHSLRAVRDAPAVSGRYPVVVYAPGLSGVAWENADWCEYLASFGYIVIASPSLGPNTRTMPATINGANAQAQDVSFLISFARTLQNADTTEIAVAGFSFGGLSSLIAAARDERIRALISLDGSQRYYPGLVEQAGDVHPAEMTLPLLSFVQRDYSLEIQDRYFRGERIGPSVLNDWTHGDLINVHMLGVAHVMLTSMYQRNEFAWWDYFHRTPPIQDDYDRNDAAVGYDWVARYSVEFLNAYLKHNAASAAFLRKTPIQNGALPHVLAANFRASSGIPFSYNGFRVEVGRRGFSHISEIFDEFKRSAPNFELKEDVMDAWGQELIANDHVAEAIGVLQFNTQMYPASSAALISLGDAYSRSGDRGAAIAAFKKSLEKDSVGGPNYVTASRKIAVLEGRFDFGVSKK